MEVFVHTAVGITGGDLASAFIAAMKKMAAKNACLAPLKGLQERRTQDKVR
jgi:hypothetical protein